MQGRSHGVLVGIRAMNGSVLEVNSEVLTHRLCWCVSIASRGNKDDKDVPIATMRSGSNSAIFGVALRMRLWISLYVTRKCWTIVQAVAVDKNEKLAKFIGKLLMATHLRLS